MAVLDPAGGRRTRRSGRRSPALRRAATLTLAVAMAAAVPFSGTAGALPTAPTDPEKEIAKLNKRAAELAKEYRGELIALNDAEKAARRAAEQAERLERELAGTREVVGRLAATSYMQGRLEPISLFAASDPATMMRDAALIEHVRIDNGRKVQNLQRLSEQADQARRTAEAKVEEVRDQIEDLEKQRDRVKKLLAKYKPEAPASGGSGGSAGRPDGVTGTKSTIIGNSMTSRMRSVLLAIDGRYGPFPAIGCYRAGDPQDHGSGHACDFMESTGGSMPSASARAHGDAVAQYAIDNASRLGIKYVIWRQRIWDVRSGGGWRAMEDRGSITANHYDHIHISVL
ncbi:hypothetical protein [Thermomonospora cellulosilytica]|uniref:Uncharacterized protein YlxW (UPF0749 family) n=1 Tax=Thermomonospora cellulosilytica TaxID=1411118 RepID=A0A7W3N0Z9_9ACTN|nr:hypothetical protein [Thermomonospora cellulosilytica]MBA9005467.1 uncharacterized protein YlxW (UPF0749 family) [Thermomonospora cellulosilytica]